MQTIHLKIEDKAYDKVMWLLSKFNKDEIEIIGDNDDFIASRKYLHAEFEELNSGKSELWDIDQADIYLEDIVKKHEDNL